MDTLTHGQLTAKFFQPKEQPLRLVAKKNVWADVIDIEVEISSQVPVVFNETHLSVTLPFVDIHSCWTLGTVGNPISMRNKGICEWRYGFESKASKLAPVACLYNLNGKNRICAALLNATDSVVFHIGAYEEERAVLLLFKFFTENGQQPRTRFRTSLRLDMRALPYYQVIADISRWYEENDHPYMPVPEAALRPVYSTWYAFHKNLCWEKVLQQCILARELGCELLILDDGWQLGDGDRDYKYTGDWQVDLDKFPDMRQHVSDIHDLGMKCMLWMSAPFVGKCSKAWLEFKDNLLFYCDKNASGVSDPRYPKVRDYIVNTCARLMRDYGFDGLKIDFIDEFDMTNAEGRALQPDKRRDTESLQQALVRLLSEIRAVATKLNPSVLIEFRQRYVGPAIRQYGNIFRVHDCPNDCIMNRMSIMDLRLLSGKTAVHSDMLVWSPEDSVENISLHFINTLFSIPQISPDLTQLSSEQLTLVRHWLGFWRQHKSLLIDGELQAFYPEMHYPVISSQQGNHKLIAIYSDMRLKLFDSGEAKITLINGTMLDTLAIDLQSQLKIQAEFFNCLGENVGNKVTGYQAGLSKLDIPVSGYAILQIMH